MFELIIIGIAIALIIGLFKLFKAIITSNFIKTLFKIILRLIIAGAVSFIVGMIGYIAELGDDQAVLMMFASFGIIITFMIILSIKKKKRIKSKQTELANEIAGFKQALVNTRKIM